MFGFFSEIKEVVGLNTKEIAKSYAVAVVEDGGILVSNFQKILSYSPNLLVLKVRNNALNIEGIEIKVKELSKNMIIASGKINKFYLSREFVDEKK